MRRAIYKYVIPELAAKGFEGEYPYYKRRFDDRIELLAFLTNKWGNSFTIEVSTVFLPASKRESNFCDGDIETSKNVTVWYTNERYRLNGMYDGWFYYTDVYRHRTLIGTFYNAVSEKRAENYTPANREKLVQKADGDIYRKVCEEVNKQMTVAYKWLDAFNKNNRFKMKLIEKFN